MSDLAGRLLRALRWSAAAAGVAAELELEVATPWASATFVGAQCRVAVSGNELEGWLAGLPEAELAVRGGFVADLVVERTVAGVVLLVLVLED